MPISVCIICFNEEKNIGRLLESSKWADEIIIVDSLSQDRTVEIASQYTDKIFTRSWTGYEDQKNFALAKATKDWVLSADADEEISEALQKEVINEISRSDAKDGYWIPRKSFYQGRWIKHSGFYPDRQLRLFRRKRACWTGGRVHERVEVKGSLGDLKNDLLHYPYKGVISGQIRTIDNFSELYAKEMYYDKGKHYNLFLLLLRPLFKFIEVYFYKLGFLDGLAGLIIAVSSAYAMFVRYVKLREIENRLENQISL